MEHPFPNQIEIEGARSGTIHGRPELLSHVRPILVSLMITIQRSWNVDSATQDHPFGILSRERHTVVAASEVK